LPKRQKNDRGRELSRFSSGRKEAPSIAENKGNAISRHRLAMQESIGSHTIGGGRLLLSAVDNVALDSGWNEQRKVIALTSRVQESDGLTRGCPGGGQGGNERDNAKKTKSHNSID
jgi:hypothetical protein